MRRAERHSARPGDVGALLREPVYFIGLTIDLVGFAFTVLALQILPLYLVQAIVAASVAVTALILAGIGRPLDRAGWIALIGSMCGLVLLGLSSEPHAVPALAAVWYWSLLAVPLVIGALGAVATRITGVWSAVLPAFGAGLAFSCVVFLGDHVRSAYALVATAGFLIAVSGAVGLARFAEPLPAPPAEPATNPSGA